MGIVDLNGNSVVGWELVMVEWNGTGPKLDWWSGMGLVGLVEWNGMGGTGGVEWDGWDWWSGMGLVEWNGNSGMDLYDDVLFVIQN
jgi:hypothetical protein